MMTTYEAPVEASTCDPRAGRTWDGSPSTTSWATCGTRPRVTAIPLACSMACASAVCDVRRAKSAKPTASVTTTIPSTARRIRAASVLPSRGIRLLRSCPPRPVVARGPVTPTSASPPSMAEQIAQNHLYRGYRRQRSQAFRPDVARSYGDATQRGERAGPMAAIELRNVTKKFATADGGTYTAIQDLSLTVEDGQFCAVVGPTGCGKSTTLTLISGLERPSRGEAFVPWRSVLDNVAAGPIYRGQSRTEAAKLARDWLRRVGLSGFEDRYPHQLSGGMRKRVALAQSLINQPRILLMDEPFSALDVQTRSIMSTELLHLWDQTKPAVVFVTHDLEEAIALADKVVVITAGPGTVKAEFEIDLPRPRVVQEIRFDPRFTRLYEQIWEALRAEVAEAYARTTRVAEVAS